MKLSFIYHYFLLCFITSSLIIEVTEDLVMRILFNLLKLFFPHLSVHLVLPSVFLGKQEIKQVLGRYIRELKISFFFSINTWWCASFTQLFHQLLGFYEMTSLSVAVIDCWATQLVCHKNTEGTWVGSSKEHFFPSFKATFYFRDSGAKLHFTNYVKQWSPTFWH